MSAPLPVRHLRIHRLAIPMRIRFEHAAAVRDVADAVIVELTAGAPYAHHVGYGETIARAYVTGETPDSVVDDIANLFAPRLANFQPATFVEALEIIEDLPTQVSGRVVTAARTAVELALLDLTCSVFRRRPADVAGWMGLLGFGPPGCHATARYSGIVLGHTQRKLSTFLRLQRLYGLRDFKLKVAIEGWEDRLAWTYRILRKGIEQKKITLRADANAGWSLLEANEAAATLESHGICALEQPLSDADDADVPYLAEQTSCHIVADESLLTIEDAQRLIDAGGVRVLNIRIAKNGGLMPALRIARLGLAAGLDIQLGCLVGETSILTAAGIAFLEACPRVRFVEGAYGRWLLRDDVARRSLRFGYGGRIRAPAKPGLGVTIDPVSLRRLAVTDPSCIQI